ncbi:class I SAM-dependent DNA methyltransferase [Blastomonas fulva]|uniref:class I SAM-dependent DNA methyltransferase n=1 Tax=Blastomonas fulva TaxID=1550728 RepID=UPI0025A3468F|nr:DNA methyltransferase [Blastomonas fulva]MDM7929829.1 class I SAM-dependent DNA methyltransferase [Blastomonas fulva]MDM7967474.1 class I SAM-dependent DNA methyltransferase [Blastomonas fulva]
MQGDASTQHQIEAFIAQWRDTGGSELANTQSFINGLCALIGVPAPDGSRTDDAHNAYVFERRVFQDNGDGTQSFGRIDCYKRDCFILEAKQGSEGDRAAALRGDDDLDIFGQTANARVKRGTARRGTPGWTRAMLQAKGQAERYAKALPTDHGWPPILLITDIGYCIDVYADFTGTGKAYAQFPDRASYRIMLDDLQDEKVRERLALIWTNPKTLDPSTRAAKATREIADYLATISKRLEARGHNAEAVSAFLMRLLFTMFAEDTGVLLPKKSFTDLLKGQLEHPEHLHHQLTALWTAMDKGEFAPSLGFPVKHFNGYLFKSREALPLERAELEVLIEAAGKDWTEVEPAIFGTLLERALNPKERAKLGAHYTPRAYVERLIAPTIMELLRSDWDGVRGAVESLMGEDKIDAARAVVEAFHAQLAQTKVLDPACGTGNFLYVAMARMKELEGEVLELLAELGDNQYLAELSGHTVTPENFLGIEINPRAAAIAQLVLWIGYLQWHFRVNGKDRSPPEPILKDIRTIENRDALIEYDKRELVKDESGKPLTRWDGETMKLHPVTGRKVPDEEARVEVYSYTKPRAAKWPKADFIVGNPPFVSSRETRELLGDGYADALRAAHASVPGNVDLVMYFWKIAADCVRLGARQFGLITTSRIRMEQNRAVTVSALARDLQISFAIPDHPWAGSDAEAGVRVAFTVVTIAKTQEKRMLLAPDHDDPKSRVSDGTILEQGDLIAIPRQTITPDLSPSVEVAGLGELKAWSNLCHSGMKPYATSLVVAADLASTLFERAGTLDKYAPRYMNGQDVARRPRDVRVLDFNDCSSEPEVRDVSELAYQYLVTHTKPERSQERNPRLRSEWWRFEASREGFRNGIKAIERYIATVENSPSRYFVFLSSTVLPDQKLRCITSDDGYLLGILSSLAHTRFSTRLGGRHGIGNTPVYNTKCATAFPFPADVPEPLKDRIRAEAEALDALRKRVLASHDDLTLTKLYNVLEGLRAGRALSEQERDMHDRGLVTLIRQHHDAIDALVAEAYGWPVDLSDEDILTRLVALNKERAAEEARGLIRYLRPEYQDPGYKAPVNETMDFGEAVMVLPDNIIPWPTTLPEQVTAVQSILTAARAPLAAQDIARSFKGKRAATVRPVLDALTGIGMARRLKDGRYAA